MAEEYSQPRYLKRATQLRRGNLGWTGGVARFQRAEGDIQEGCELTHQWDRDLGRRAREWDLAVLHAGADGVAKR